MLYSFAGLPDGSLPNSSLIRDSAGNLYGATVEGGVRSQYCSGGGSGCGVVYRVDATGHETVLYAFPHLIDGATPDAGVILDAAGNLYGTTYGAGAVNLGTVYSVHAAGAFTVLHSFSIDDGHHPMGGVIRDAAGNLYGSAQKGDVDGSAAGGAVYMLDTTGHETVLFNFQHPAQGVRPLGSLLRDAQGNLYGTTYGGGKGAGGVVYKLSPAGQQTVLYSFTGGADGGKPYAGVVRDAAGNLYGTTSGGGTGINTCYLSNGVPGGGCGVVFKLDPAGNETVLYTFTGGADGGNPYGGVVQDAAGNLYGTTANGGSFANCFTGCGVIFKVDSSGHETVLYTFTGGADGAAPWAGVSRDSVGNLYGTTQYGGTSELGVVFMLDPAGNESVLHSFTGGADGSYPVAGVVRDSAGNLYGTTSAGGKQGDGVVFKLIAQ